MNLLVVVHIYYEDLWSELAASLAHLHDPFDLRVTCVQHLEAISAMVHAEFPDARVELVENRGFDVGPFLHVIDSVDLDNYDAVVKLHTKRDIPPHYEMRVDVTGSRFRNLLLSFAKSPEAWQSALGMLKEDVGMVGEGTLFLNKFSDTLRDYRGVLDVMRRMKMPFQSGFFVAGSMFIVRASLLKPFQSTFPLSAFDVPDRSKGDCLPHFLERAFGYAVYAQGLRLADWRGRSFVLPVYWWRIGRFFFRVHYGKRHNIYRVFGIPVWYHSNSKD